MKSSSPLPLKLADAITALASPYAMEAYSSLTGESLLVVDLRDAADLEASETAVVSKKRATTPMTRAGVARWGPPL